METPSKHSSDTLSTPPFWKHTKHPPNFREFVFIPSVAPSCELELSKYTSLAAKGALAHRLQCCTACTAAPPATPQRLQRCTACNTAPPATPHRLLRRTARNTAPPAMPHHAPPAMPYRLKNPIWPPGGPKMADGVWKGVSP